MSTALIKSETGLDSRQEDFARWLALLPIERIPNTQKEYAAKIGVTEETLSHWKKLPELWNIVWDNVVIEFRLMLPKAQEVIRDALAGKPVSQVQLKAAIDLQDRYGEMKRHASVMVTIKDAYDKYHAKG